MKVLVCLDSFKGSLSSLRAGGIVRYAIDSLDKDYEVEICPVADGGEGFLDAICYNKKCKQIVKRVSSPLGSTIDCEYLICDNTAYIEVSNCIGLGLVKNNKNPLYTSTYGLGELILHAISIGCKNFVIGIGGSCTNDGGVGMLQALGYQFLDKRGEPIKRGAIGLKSLVKIKDNCNINFKDYSFTIACDVTNGLVGKSGCSKVFAKQKGATKKDIYFMDKWLKKYAKLTKKLFPNADKNGRGAGASGGLGFAFKEYLNAKVASGIETIIKELSLQEKIKNADIVVVGEGKLDSQSLMGKAPLGIAKLAKSNDKKVIALAGIVELEEELLIKHGVDIVCQIKPNNQSLQEAMVEQNAKTNLYNATQKIFKNL